MYYGYLLEDRGEGHRMRARAKLVGYGDLQRKHLCPVVDISINIYRQFFN